MYRLPLLEITLFALEENPGYNEIITFYLQNENIICNVLAIA